MTAKELIDSKITTLLERLKRLKSYRDVSFKEFTENPEVKDIVERNLQVAIEACLDIGKIIISEKGF